MASPSPHIPRHARSPFHGAEATPSVRLPGRMGGHIIGSHVIMWSLVLLALLFAWGETAAAAVPARLQRVDVRARDQATRLLFKLDQLPPYSVSTPSDRVLRLRFGRTTAPLFKKLRKIQDRLIAGVSIRPRMGDLIVDISWRDQ